MFNLNYFVAAILVNLPVCVLECLLRSSDLEKALLQSLHTNGFSPEKRIKKILMIGINRNLKKKIYKYMKFILCF